MSTYKCSILVDTHSNPQCLLHILPIQPLVDSMVHVPKLLIRNQRRHVGPRMFPLPGPRSRQIPMRIRIFVQLLLRKRRHCLPIHRDNLILLIYKLRILDLPPTRIRTRAQSSTRDRTSSLRGDGSLQAIHDEARVAVDVVLNLCGWVDEALGDGDFHLADGAVGAGVEVDKSAKLAMCHEDPILTACLGVLDEGVNGLGAIAAHYFILLVLLGMS